MRPALLRPPVLRRPSVSALTGFPFHNSRRSTMTSCRCEGVVGLKVFSAILSLPGLDSGGHVDPRAFAKGHDRLLVVGAPADPAAKALQLSLDPDRIDCGHLDIEQPLDRRPDLALCGLQRDAKDDLVVLRNIGRLFGDDRRQDGVEHLLARELCLDARNDAKAAHLRRASRCSTAARVNTSMSRRRISKTLAPCCGSTSTCGRLRAARAKPSSTLGPSMINTDSQPSASSRWRNDLVLASAMRAASMTTSLPSLCLADNAVFRPSRRTFFCNPKAWLRTTGPKMRAPPRNCGERRLP